MVKSTLYISTYPQGPNFGLFCSTTSCFEDTIKFVSKIGNVPNDIKMTFKLNPSQSKLSSGYTKYAFVPEAQIWVYFTLRPAVLR